MISRHSRISKEKRMHNPSITIGKLESKNKNILTLRMNKFNRSTTKKHKKFYEKDIF